jgi:hypothetical protein
MLNRQNQFWGWVLFLSLIPLMAQGASVLTNDGQTLKGKILEDQPDFILLELDEDKVQMRIDRSQVAFVEKEEEKEDFKREYFVSGSTLSYPAGINVVLGYYGNDFGLRVAGAYWGPVSSGVQANLLLKLGESKDFLHGLSLVGGITNLVEGHRGWYYAGIGYEINFHGLQLEADLVTPYQANTLVIPIQIGFVKRFE